MTKSSSSSVCVSPTPSPGWTRCHAYLSKKSRFCRQKVVPGSDFCGHHAHHIDKNTTEICNASPKQTIPCPLDPSHRIVASRLNRHLHVCPARTKQRSQQEAPYFRKDINRGTSDDATSSEDELNLIDAAKQQEWAHRVARRVLEINSRLFSASSLPSDQVEDNHTTSIPLVDLSQGEFQRGLEFSVQNHRIKTGGKHHLHQQASLIGHLRRMGAFENITRDKSSNTVSTTVLEMGAGRGILGLLVTGILLAKDNASTVKFVMVERAGTRAKADSVLRSTATAKKEEKDGTSYMSLFHHEGRLTWERIPCDLAHVHVPTVLRQLPPAEHEPKISGEETSIKDPAPRRQQRIFVVAKHLCGAGTDLALRSLREVRDIHACLFATCCHGVCSWKDYVGQDVLRREFQNASFGAKEFELLRRWSSGAIHSNPCHDDASSCEIEDNGHSKQEEEGGASEHKEDPLNVNSIVQSLQLDCGAQGLGRACQRLLDYGRCEYMREVVFHNEPGTHVEMLHYVSPDVTLQNMVLLGYRTKNNIQAIN